jgi:uncharacterized protein (DUF2126 family)
MKVLAEVGRAVDARARAAGLALTSGGELTFTIPCTLDPEWRSEALGEDKRARADALAAGLARRLGAEVSSIPGRKYEGEAEPRWCLQVATRRGRGVPTTVTPDPGVVEVNLAPARSVAALTRGVVAAYDAAEEAGLAAHRLLSNGRVLGSGGGAHVTLGGPTLRTCPFTRRPRLLADMVAFAHAHPSLSFAFVGLGAGPTSQAPRADESGVDRVRDLAATMAALRARPATSLADVHAALQPILTDLTGNTHRAELNVEKIPALGVLELRAVEAPPRADMWLAASVLFRAIAVRMAERAASARGRSEPIVDWGERLHDEWLLPSVMRADLARVAAEVGLPDGLCDPLIDHRYGVLGVVEAPGVRCTVRQALEPWPVLGALARQETAGSRVMDSSTDRIEVALTGPRADRVLVVVAGRTVPRAKFGRAWIGGVRWRAIEASAGGLHPFAPLHAPLDLALVDRASSSVLAAARYHAWAPGGRLYDGFPRDLDDAAARRAARFEVLAPRRGKKRGAPAPSRTTLDLVRDG